MKKGDIYVALLILIVAVLWYWILKSGNDRAESSGVSRAVSISVDGTEVMELSLFEDRSEIIRGVNGYSCEVNITSGKADVVWADCPDKLCVNQRAIASVGETIVCLPARIVIEIKEEGEPFYDGISGSPGDPGGGCFNGCVGRSRRGAL